MTDTSICPTCGAKANLLMHWPFSGRNNSVFNYKAEFMFCDACGLVYIKNINDITLACFYQQECCYSECDHFDVHSESNIRKYSHYLEVLQHAGLDGSNLVDIGCGRGGFLGWLSQIRCKTGLIGVEIDLRSMPVSTYAVRFVEGNALSLPFENGSKECLSYLHVLEHIRATGRVLDEAWRVLSKGGSIMIEVPDSERYSDHSIGPAFWMAIREHVNHFTTVSATSALRRHGFEVVHMVRSELPTPEFTYPSLVIVARKVFSRENVFIQGSSSVAEYALAAQQALQALKQRLEERAGKESITFWACSSIIFSLLPLLDHRQVRVCDMDTGKQGSTVHRITIENPCELSPEGVLVIGSTLHKEAIRASALELGWPPTAIEAV